MSTERFRSAKARQVLNALLRAGWVVTRQKGSHRTLRRGTERYTWAFDDGDELGDRILKKIAEKTGLKPEDI